MVKPKRPYELIISIGADSLEEMSLALKQIAFDITRNEQEANPRTCVSGSPSSRYSFSLAKTDTADHDEYFKQVDEYLEIMKEQKDA